MFFHLLSTIEVKLVYEMIQSTYLCYFAYQAQKLTIHRDFNLISNSWWNPRWRQRWRLLLVTSKTQRPPVVLPLKRYTSSFWEDQRISTKGKVVSKYFNISKTVELPRTQTSLFKTCAQRKVRRRQRARHASLAVCTLPMALAVHQQSLVSHWPLPCEKRSA